MTIQTEIRDHLPVRAHLKRQGGLWGRVVDLIAIRKERIDLSQLDKRLLADLGISETEARIEAKRPLWDAPDRWRR